MSSTQSLLCVEITSYWYNKSNQMCQSCHHWSMKWCCTRVSIAFTRKPFTWRRKHLHDFLSLFIFVQLHICIFLFCHCPFKDSIWFNWSMRSVILRAFYFFFRRWLATLSPPFVIQRWPCTCILEEWCWGPYPLQCTITLYHVTNIFY